MKYNLQSNCNSAPYPALVQFEPKPGLMGAGCPA